LAATMRKEAIVAWFRIASRRTTAGEYDEFRSAISRRQQIRTHPPFPRRRFLRL
jgi:hypothetical protein